MIRYAVVTRVPASLEVLEPYLTQEGAPAVRGSEFVTGEVLIVDDAGLEVTGRRRHAAEFDVDVELFDLATQAIVRAQEVAAAASAPVA